MIVGALIFFAGLVVGALPLIALCLRALRDDAWDSSNVLNVLRVLAHLAIHPSDFAHMAYVNEFGEGERWCFPYIDGDEFSDHFPVRPPGA